MIRCLSFVDVAVVDAAVEWGQRLDSPIGGLLFLRSFAAPSLRYVMFCFLFCFCSLRISLVLFSPLFLCRELPILSIYSAGNQSINSIRWSVIVIMNGAFFVCLCWLVWSIERWLSKVK
jgi:hypothetical protein